MILTVYLVVTVEQQWHAMAPVDLQKIFLKTKRTAQLKYVQFQYTYYDEGIVGIFFFTGYPKIVFEQGHCNTFRQHTILCVGEQAFGMPLWPTLLQRQASKKVTGYTATRKVGCNAHTMIKNVQLILSIKHQQQGKQVFVL